MGGVIILLGLVSVLFWSDLTNINILFLYIAISFGLLVHLMTTERLSKIILQEFHPS